MNGLALIALILLAPLLGAMWAMGFYIYGVRSLLAGSKPKPHG